MPDAPPGGPSLPSILIVEDDFDNRETLADILEGEGYPVARAKHGREALELMTGGFTPNVILLDLMMPVMDGWEFRTQQGANPAFADIPVVVMTGDGQAGQKSQAMGAANYITKPIDVDTLFELIQRYCK